MEHESLLRDIRRYQEQLKRWEAEKNSPHWGEPHGDGFCVAYETRYYSAILTNLPQNHNWVRACYETPMHIHGVKLDSPERCELVGSDVVGHWRVSFNEPQCRTFWSGFWDKGCSQEGSHKRRIETRLENLRREFDWWETCNTTPVQIHGVHYASPAFCYPINGWKGMLALWEIDDQSC
ncbi:hypothetical protein JAAARDRAFT_28027 [Jaapia argillacea MUCL 33604]|uniref:Uncharacterized protein n=1 Tax=Jaapia argillacea MUCL 33604 TaxID=933084 RepID=A0A067QBQ3_9AGAM|nr:hypothetical protein JAAARDRAFT_28027 [Jaapia argillacea MUCL 33604]